MATQLARVYVLDPDDDPIEGALVAFNNTNTGVSFFATTGIPGIAALPLEEGVYAVSVAVPDHVTPPPVRIEVSPPPVATVAEFNPPAMAAPGLISATAKNITVIIGEGSPVVVDVSGGDDVVADADEIATNINVALGAAYASLVLGEIRLSSVLTGDFSQASVSAIADSVLAPGVRIRVTTTAIHFFVAGGSVRLSGGTGYDGTHVVQFVNDTTHFEVLAVFAATGTGVAATGARLTIVNDGTVVDSAIAAVFGVPDGASSMDDIVVDGEDVPADWNDFNVVMLPYGPFVAVDPQHCMLYGRFWRHELSQPLAHADVWVEVVGRIETLVRPTAIDVGIDVGDSFTISTDENGYLHFEVMRGSRVRVYLSWQDREFEFLVPDAASANLDALMTPYVEAIEISNSLPAVSLLVGKSLGFATRAVFTDGSKTNLVYGLTYASSNGVVASFVGSTLTANQLGSTLVTVTCTNTRGEVLTSPPITVTII